MQQSLFFLSILPATTSTLLLPIGSVSLSLMDANMSPEAASQTKRSVWLTNIYHFFHLPNTNIFTLFIVSSTATFFLGVAMIIQWVFHGQYYPGFRWMVYSASAITSLPILIWIIVLLFAIRFNASSSSSSSCNLVKAQQSHAYQLADTEAAAAPEADELAMVQPEILDHHPSGLTEEQPTCKTLIPVSQPRNSNVDDKQALKRTLSLPLSDVPTDCSKLKRTMSLKQ